MTGLFVDYIIIYYSISPFSSLRINLLISIIQEMGLFVDYKYNISSQCRFLGIKFNGIKFIPSLSVCILEPMGLIVVIYIAVYFKKLFLLSQALNYLKQLC